MSAPIKTPLTLNDALEMAGPLCAAQSLPHKVEHCGYCEDTARALMAVDVASRTQALEDHAKPLAEALRPLTIRFNLLMANGGINCGTEHSEIASDACAALSAYDAYIRGTEVKA